MDASAKGVVDSLAGKARKTGRIDEKEIVP